MRGVFFLNGIVSYENVKCKLFLKCFLSGHQLFAELVPRSGREILNFCDAFYYKNVIFRLYLDFFTYVSRHVVEKLCREAAKNFAFLCAISVSKT